MHLLGIPRHLLLATVALAATSAFAQRISADERAIRAAIASIEQGWNEGSGAKFAAPFAPDADYVVVNGMHFKSRETIDRAHQGLFSGIYKGSVNKATIKSVRFPRPDVALTHVEWHLKFGPDLAQSGRAMNTSTWIKTRGKWQIAAFQNSPIQDVQRR